MAKSVLNAPHFQSEKAAFAYVEAVIWADGRSCPHCGVLDQSKPMNGKTTRPGLYKCYACRKPFTVRQGTIFEGSHLALHLWLQVIHLMCASKKGISTRQIQRMLSCSMKTAWFLSHRIREAMKPGADASRLVAVARLSRLTRPISAPLMAFVAGRLGAVCVTSRRSCRWSNAAATSVASEFSKLPS
jgi:transposase-like protein